MRKYRREHPDKIREYWQQWEAHNPEKVKASKRKWRLNNLAKERATARRGIRKLRKRIFDKYGEVCAWCGSTKQLELDHVYNDALPAKTKGHPARNGRSGGLTEWREALADTKGRFQMLCKKCNLSKRLLNE